MIPMTGWISARFGRKRYFMLSLFSFICASALCGAARSLGQMIVFRLVQGLAGAAMVPSSQAIMMETFPPEEQQLAMATLGRRDDGSAGHRAYAGRLDYRQLELALEFLYQRSSRHRRIAYGLGLRP